MKKNAGTTSYILCSFPIVLGHNQIQNQVHRVVEARLSNLSGTNLAEDSEIMSGGSGYVGFKSHLVNLMPFGLAWIHQVR